MARTDLLNPSAPLLSPVAIPRTPASEVKHHRRSNEGEQGCYVPLYLGSSGGVYLGIK